MEQPPLTIHLQKKVK